MLKTAIRAGLIALAVPTAALGTTYDAYSSFNGTNPAGNFQYKSAGLLLTAPAGDCVSGLTGLTCLQTATGSDGAGFYTSQNNLTLSTESGTNNVHINNTGLVVSPDTGAGVFFIAPTGGIYSIYALFNAQDDLATGVTITRFLSLSAVNSFAPVGSPNSVPSNLSFSQMVTLGAGDTFGFVFGPGQDNSHDLTGFSFTVSDAVPEPATWMTMLLGFGLIGVAMRRRSRASPATAPRRRTSSATR
jgi:PEP-CTERM motif